MYLVRVVLGTLLAASALVLAVPAPPASACSCATGTFEDHAEGGDVIFRGAVVDTSEQDNGMVTYTFDVDEVFQGGTGATTEIRSAKSGAACGLEYVEIGDDLLVFAYPLDEPRDALGSGLCGGTQDATPRVLRQIEAVTGPGQPPDPGSTRIDDDEAAQPFIPYRVMATIGFGAVGLLGLGLWRLRRATS